MPNNCGLILEALVLLLLGYALGKNGKNGKTETPKT